MAWVASFLELPKQFSDLFPGWAPKDKLKNVPARKTTILHNLPTRRVVRTAVRDVGTVGVLGISIPQGQDRTRNQRRSNPRDPEFCAKSAAPSRITIGAKMITKIILETILICNRTNKKLSGKVNSFRVGDGNFENSKLFEGLVIFEHNTLPHT